jgi:hypothetical protein
MTVPVPLPGGKADELLQHLSNCPQCKGAKVANTPDFCPVGKQLIRLTMKERHGSV